MEYPKEAVFTQERLAQIKPQDILRWMNVRTFGVPNPPLDADPFLARHTSVEYWKKAISSFMPNRLHPWNELAQTGNPTRSNEINDLIKRVKKKEVRNEGVPSQARRPITETELIQTQTILREKPEYGNITKYGIPGFINFQIHMISRIDCASQWVKVNFEPHDQFPRFAAKVRLPWAKNVNEEGDAPWQIVLGAMNPVLCVFIGLAIWLEFYLGQSQGLSPYVFAFSSDFRIPDGGDKTNNFIKRILHEIYNGDDFVAERGGGLGSHSNRKYAGNRCRRSGGTKDDKEYRGRWKNRRRVSDVYGEHELPYPDAKVAGFLCAGGPCSYCIKSGSRVSEEWILQHVVPNIASSTYGTSLAKILGKALLWTIFSANSQWVPNLIVERVKTAYYALLGEEDNTNPIERRLLVITGADAMLVINEVTPVQGEGAAVVGQQQQQQQQQADLVGGHLEGQSNRQVLHTILSQITQLQASVSELREARAEDRVNLQNQFRVLNTNIRRIVAQPARQLAARPLQNRNNNGGGLVRPQVQAELSPTPRSLYILWQEYNEGVGGRKAARLFSSEERGRAKHKYCRRKNVWDLVSRLIRTGISSDVAIDRIYDVYGVNTPVTRIIDRIKVDRRNNSFHPTLQV
jgi:hypothetical protein